jgi:hypothetical protein
MLTYTIIGADGAEYGPVTADEVRQWIAEGRANGRSKVRAAGSTEWKPLVEYLEFASALAGSAPPPTPGAVPITIGPIPTAPRNNPFAVAALVLGIISLPVACCCYGFPFNVLAIIFGIVALSQIKRDPVNQLGRGMAIAGLVLGVASLALGGLVFALGVALNSSEILQKLQQR